MQFKLISIYNILTTDCYWANINTRFEIRSVDLAHLRLGTYIWLSLCLLQLSNLLSKPLKHFTGCPLCVPSI